MTGPREVTAMALAGQLRQRCVCLEEDGTSSCQCPAPVTREQAGRLRAYLSLHPDRAVIYSELAGEWLAALHAFLPAAQDPVIAWLQAPFDVPATADLRHAAALDALLDSLGAPPAAAMSLAMHVNGRAQPGYPLGRST